MDVLNLAAAALLSQGRTQDGIRQLRRATALAPSAKAHAHLGGVLAATGDFDDAIASYRAAVAAEPDFADAWSTLAALLKALARYDEAEACCCAGLRVVAGHAALKHTLATVLFEQGARRRCHCDAARVARARSPPIPPRTASCCAC